MSFITTSSADWATGSTSVSGVSGQTIHIVSHSTENSEIGVMEKVTYNEETKKAEISPKLYFSYVKSKLNKVQQKRLNHQIKKLAKLVEQAKDIGQDAAQEEYAKLLAIAIREQEAYVCGIQRYIDKDLINKYKDNVKDRVIKWSTLEEFPRVIPEEIREKIKAVKKRNLFDNYYVLYTDYTDEKIKSTKDKIIEKDPILFGEYSYQKNRLYFIADWIDEYCDLTIEKFVNEISEKEIGDMTSFKKVPKLDKEYFEEIKKEVKRREDNLKNTGRGNWREKALEEERAKQRKAKKPWWKFWGNN